MKSRGKIILRFGEEPGHLSVELAGEICTLDLVMGGFELTKAAIEGSDEDLVYAKEG